MIYDLFFGYIKTINKCEKCNKIINTIYQPFSLINLYLKDINGNYIKDLITLIETYEKEKTINMLCNCSSKIIQKTMLCRIPQILVFKFERVVNGKHINHEIKYPKILYMKNYSNGFLDKSNNKTNPELKFNLVGVMLHYGSAFGGHKTSYTKNFFDNKWYYFNDSFKREESEDSILNDKEAFMLFYISDSCIIHDNNKKSIIDKAESNSTQCNYYSEGYKYIYSSNYNYNINNHIKYDTNPPKDVESKEIKQNNNFYNNINSINGINNIENNISDKTKDIN